MHPCAALLLLALLCACTNPPARAPAVPGPNARQGDCTLACLRWTEQCDADPRGVYRCQRRCERFAEHCE